MCGTFLKLNLKGDKWRRLEQWCTIMEKVPYSMKRLSTHPVNQVFDYIEVISHISYETRPLGSRTPSSDGAFIVSHQVAHGVTFCEEIYIHKTDWEGTRALLSVEGSHLPCRCRGAPPAP